MHQNELRKNALISSYLVYVLQSATTFSSSNLNIMEHKLNFSYKSATLQTILILTFY